MEVGTGSPWSPTHLHRPGKSDGVRYLAWSECYLE